MKIRDNLIGKDVLDYTGHKIGEVDDIDVDFEGDRIDSIIVGEGKLIGRGDKRIVPFNMVETVGERVILKRETGERERSMGEREDISGRKRGLEYESERRR